MVQVDEFQPRRKVAKPRRISEIRVGEEFVRVTGCVAYKKNSEIVLDDGSGMLTVFSDDSGMFRDVDIGSKIRVFGTPLITEGGQELKAEIVQKVDGLDLQLLEKVMEEVKKFESEVKGEESVQS